MTLWPPLQWLSALFPVTHAVRALREVMIAGGGFADVAWELAALVAFAVAMVALGVCGAAAASAPEGRPARPSATG